MTSRPLAAVLAALFLGACATEVPTLQPTPDATLVAAPTAADLPPFPGSVGATAWVTETEPPPGMGPDDTTASDPAALVQDVAVLLRSNVGDRGVEVRADLLEGGAETATGLVQITGFGDDSVAGQEYLLTLSRGSRGWYVAEARMRTHCRRGVSGDVCV